MLLLQRRHVPPRSIVDLFAGSSEPNACCGPAILAKRHRCGLGADRRGWHDGNTVATSLLVLPVGWGKVGVGWAVLGLESRVRGARTVVGDGVRFQGSMGPGKLGMWGRHCEPGDWPRN